MMTEMKIIEKISWSSKQFGSQSSVENFGKFGFWFPNIVNKQNKINKFPPLQSLFDKYEQE